MHTLATCTGSVPSFTRPARTSFSSAVLNAAHGPKRRLRIRSARTLSIDASAHWICSWMSRKNAVPFGSPVICSALRTIMSATTGKDSPSNEDSPSGSSSAIWRRNFSSISSMSAIRSACFDSKCQYTAPFVIFRRAAMSVKVVCTYPFFANRESALARIRARVFSASLCAFRGMSAHIITYLQVGMSMAFFTTSRPEAEEEVVAAAAGNPIPSSVAAGAAACDGPSDVRHGNGAEAARPNDDRRHDGDARTSVRRKQARRRGQRGISSSCSCCTFSFCLLSSVVDCRTFPPTFGTGRFDARI